MKLQGAGFKELGILSGFKKKELGITVSTQHAQVSLWPPHTVSQHQRTLHIYGNGQFGIQWNLWSAEELND